MDKIQKWSSVKYWSGGLLGLLLLGLGCDRDRPVGSEEGPATAELRLRLVYEEAESQQEAGKVARIRQTPGDPHWETRDPNNWGNWLGYVEQFYHMESGAEVNRKLTVEGNQARGTLRVKPGFKLLFVGCFENGELTHTGMGDVMADPEESGEAEIVLSPWEGESYAVDEVRVLVFHLWDLEVDEDASVAITFADANLEAVVREAVEKPEGEVTQADVEGIVVLTARAAEIADLTGIEALTQLTELHLNSNQISDVSSLSGLTQLTKLILYGNQISDVSALSGLTQLTILSLYENQIGDVSPLSGLTQLTELHLYSNQINDVGPLSGLTQLTTLSLSNNQIGDVSPLSDLTQLTTLSLNNTQISDVSPLSGLTQLSWLNLSYNQISDIAPLADNSGLGSGDTVALQGNPLNDEAYSTHIPALQSLGVEVRYDEPSP